MESAIDLEREHKIKIARLFDFDTGFEPLRNLFEERKRMAELMEIGYSNPSPSEMIDLINKKIRAHLGV